MLYNLYEHHIIQSLQVFPRELCIMLSREDIEADSDKLIQVVSWVRIFPAIEHLIFHISSEDADSGCSSSVLDAISALARVRMSTPAGERVMGNGPLNVLIVLGKSGRSEITDAIVKIAAEDIAPDDITEETIEQHLLYQVAPDFMIKTGGSNLTDFLIWQSVYSELFFTDINWKRFRKVDFIRALRDYQSRVRRFGT